MFFVVKNDIFLFDHRKVHMIVQEAAKAKKNIRTLYCKFIGFQKMLAYFSVKLIFFVSDCFFMVKKVCAIFCSDEFFQHIYIQ